MNRPPNFPGSFYETGKINQQEVTYTPFYDSFSLKCEQPITSMVFCAREEISGGQIRSREPRVYRGQGFLATGIRFQLFPLDCEEHKGEAWNRLQSCGLVKFSVGSCIYYEVAPIGARDMRKFTPVYIQPQQNFMVQVDFPDEPFEPLHDGTLYCYLLGYRYRRLA